MNNLKIIGFVLMFVLGFSILFANAQNKPSTKNTVSFTGFSSVKIGMTVSQASKALGATLVGEEDSEGNCSYFSSKTKFKELSFMVIDRKIVRVDIDSKIYATDRGARVGDTEARIKQLYKGMVNISPHKYVDGHYLMINMKGGKYQIIFETDGKRVTSFRAGKLPEVGWVEGCS
jgi:hypothetical protein